MKLDWKAQPAPGKFMFNLELGTSYADVVIHVVFDTSGGKSEAEVTLEPSLYCSWWNLRD